MINFKSLAGAAALLLASPVLAGSTDAPVFPVTPIAIPVAPAAANDWSGFYAGGMVSLDDAGSIQFFINGNSGSAFPDDSATTFGGFAGYNFQNEAFVYGGELAVSSGGFGADGIPETYFETIFDLKGKAGYSFGDVLVYGVLGGSYTNLHAGVNDLPSVAFSYGAGVDYLISDHLFVGAEYLMRTFSGERVNDPTQTMETSIQSTQLRVGWKF